MYQDFIHLMWVVLVFTTLQLKSIFLNKSRSIFVKLNLGNFKLNQGKQVEDQENIREKSGKSTLKYWQTSCILHACIKVVIFKYICYNIIIYMYAFCIYCI